MWRWSPFLRKSCGYCRPFLGLLTNDLLFSRTLTLLVQVSHCRYKSSTPGGVCEGRCTNHCNWQHKVTLQHIILLARVMDTAAKYQYCRARCEGVQNLNNHVEVGIERFLRLCSTYEFQPNSSVVLEARQRFIVSLSNSTLKFPASKSPKRPLA